MGVTHRDRVKAGAFTLLELKKDGDKFTGKVNMKWVRPDGGATYPAQCLTLVTPERIEGRTMNPPPTAQIDWKKCSFSSNPQWQDFTWIPVK
jgi:hypothetical protein